MQIKAATKVFNVCSKQHPAAGYNFLHNRMAEKNNIINLQYPADKVPKMIDENQLNSSIRIQSGSHLDIRLGCLDSNGPINLRPSMCSTFPVSLDLAFKKDYNNDFIKMQGMKSFHTLCNNKFQNKLKLSCYNESTSTNSSKTKLSRKDMLKKAIKEYGSTVIVFHVGISLVSLGTCYLLISSGVDMGKLLNPLGLSGAAATNAGTFVTAYAIHKVFAPVRISITLAATPFIVRYLRNIGFLKHPKV